ncbi:putative late blight resistance protein homolog R1A-10 [Salvia miltiorrhiza]|uniref:putative late blight resistance protein homolog R1A-10 n=1 Tax=Salvia miltiorrhiza TaxID=226208 RepID=UPI0025AC1E79|nr:putative late blight resistance protein homolog R1A-10 [Salvia miltiorrhiza]
MAFASAISLKNTIERLINSSRIFLVPPSQEILQFAYKKLQSLQQTLTKLDSSSKRISRKRVNALDAQIREAVSQFEDLLESHLLDQISSQSELNHPLKFSIDLHLQHLTQDVDSFVEMAEKMEDAYANELDNLLPEEEDEAADFGESKSKMVGLSDLFGEIRHQFTRPRYAGLPVFSLFGMAGIGKTTLAKEIFDDPLILSHFDCCAWAKVGRKCELNEIPRSILAQVDKAFREGDDEQMINQYLYEFLKDKRYLIVLDDVWETEVWEYLRNYFPNSDDGRSRILITTRLREVADHTTISSYSNIKTVPLLNKEESWDLFREKVFGEEWCPPKLEEAGKKIVKHCDGLPLTIIKVAELLSKAEITVEYWNEVAADKENSVFMDVYGEISKILVPSYEYLPQRLKPCFLYMGVFPQGYEILRSKLIDMWIAEGFLVPKSGEILEDCGTKCLVELVSNSLVVVCDKSTILRRKMKTCRLHSSLWHFSKMELLKNKFFAVLNSRANGLEECLRGQRRLSIKNNVLLGIKDVCDTIEDECAFTARSLLCLGPYHQYPVPLGFSLKFLKVLRALSIRLYEFPIEVLELLQLRYLALTYNGNLPGSVSKLFNLQFLIIHRHLSFKSHPSQSYVPVEIWDMKELKHLQIMGSDLPESTSGAFLENLRTLLGVSIDSCTEGVLEKISNLEKLGIQIELLPDDDNEPFGCLNHVSRLDKLESLKCIVVNPELLPEPEIVAPPAPVSMFPSSLLKLHLSGLCYPWEYMDIIGLLPKLEVLKLQCYAFRGPRWEVDDFKFPRLRFLVMEDSDLVEWKVGSGCFSRLRHLSIKHCYNLEEFRWDFDYYFKEVQVVDSNPLAQAFFNQIKDRRGRRFLDVSFHSSWDDGKLRS